MNLKELNEICNINISLTFEHDYASCNWNKALVNGEWEDGWTGGDVCRDNGEWSNEDESISEGMMDDLDAAIFKKIEALGGIEAIIGDKAEGWKAVAEMERDGIHAFATLDWAFGL